MPAVMEQSRMVGAPAVSLPLMMFRTNIAVPNKVKRGVAYCATSLPGPPEYCESFVTTSMSKYTKYYGKDHKISANIYSVTYNLPTWQVPSWTHG